jgi:uncharacterized protein YukE
MTFPLSAGDSGMRAVLSAFADADQTTKAVRNGVTAGMAGMRWTGDSSTVYRGSMALWLDGLQKVEQGLLAMNEAMQAHGRRTTTADEHARNLARFPR